MPVPALTGRWMQMNERWRAAHRVPLVSPYETSNNVDSMAFDNNVVITQNHRITLPGVAFRLSVSNEFGRQPAALTLRTGYDEHPVLFRGADTVRLGPGEKTWSDPVVGDVAAGDIVVVSISSHGDAREPATYNPSLNHTTTLSRNDGIATVSVQFYVAGIDVLTDDESPLVVALGDSITAGFGGTVHGYPGVLAAHHARNVVNLGIPGNRLTANEIGPSVRHRLRRDALSDGADLVVLQAGINDLAALRPDATLDRGDGDDLAAALLGVAAAVRDAGADVIVSTLPPVRGCRYPQFRRQGIDIARERTNRVILDGPFDALPLHELLAQPGAADTLAEHYDSGDGIHPNDAAAHTVAGRLNQLLSKNTA